MTATKFAQIVNQHRGEITAQDDTGLTRVQFDCNPRAGGFHDEMVSRFVPVVERDRDRYIVLVQL